VLAGADGQLRLPPMINSIAFLGRIYFTGAPAMAIARNCLDWSRDFVNRRTIDGRPLGDYDGIQRIVSAAMSDVYAMDSLVRWCLLDSGITDRWLERFVAKNVLTRTAWRLADRTVSLMGAEGFETVGSKRSRGGVPLPVERALRDARGLRIAGNVDFQLDAQVMRLLLQGWYGADRPVLDAAAADPAGLDLTPANLDHLAAVSGQVRRFAELCAGVTRRRRDPQAPLADERFLVLTGRLAAELVTAAAVLGRTARLGTDAAQDLAGLHCAAARHRLAGLWRELDHTDHPDHRKASRAWLSGSGFQFLTGGGHDHH
jgi:hypothetical protein